MKFFCDNNISHRITKALSMLAQPIEVIHLTDKFPANTPDEEWIVKMKQEGYIIISGDPKIAKRPHQKKALLDSQLTVFFLAKGWMNLQFWKHASALVRVFPEIMRLSKENPSSSVFEVTKGGQIIQK